MRRIFRNLFATHDATDKDARGSVQAHANTGALRTETLDGVEYLVVPVIPVKEGVLNGRFVSAEEISAHVAAWNGIPVPVNHPEIGGIHVSANDPAIISRQSIGQFFNATFDRATRALKGELWLNVKKAEQLGGEAKQAVDMAKRGAKLEVSSAFFGDLLDKFGKFDGQPYQGAWLNLRPDHIAVLPNGVGACSWDDGCGVRANSRAEDSVTAKLFAALCRGFGINVDTTEEPMKEKLISALIAHSKSAFTEKDRAFLDGLDEERLAAFAKSAGCSCQTEDDDGDAGDGPAAHSEQVKKTIKALAAHKDCKLTEAQLDDLSDEALAAFAERFEITDDSDDDSDDAPATFEALLDKMPDSPAKAAFAAFLSTHGREREQRIEALSKSGKCKLTKEQLAAMPDDALSALSESFGVTEPDERNYAGRGMPNKAPVVHGKPSESNKAPAPPSIVTNRKFFDAPEGDSKAA